MNNNFLSLSHLLYLSCLIEKVCVFTNEVLQLYSDFIYFLCKRSGLYLDVSRGKELHISREIQWMYPMYMLSFFYNKLLYFILHHKCFPHLPVASIYALDLHVKSSSSSSRPRLDCVYNYQLASSYNHEAICISVLRNGTKTKY